MSYLLEHFFTWLLQALSLNPETSLGKSLHFFLTDTTKILIYLSLMIFSISYLRSYFQPNKTKRILTRFKGIGGNIVASLLGVVTPFCSCSSVPLFIAFVESGVPLGLTFSFLITSPLVNEAAFALMISAFGWKIAFIYLFLGIILGVLGGILIGWLKLEKYVEDYVYKFQSEETADEIYSQKDRLNYAAAQLSFIFKKVWGFVLIGVGLGAIIHGWVPEGALSAYAGGNSPQAVIIAVLLGVPLYSNAMGMIPVAQALIGKGVGLGTALSFMMAVTALSLPEMIILKKVIKLRLILIFAGIVTVGIIICGYLFNFIYYANF